MSLAGHQEDIEMLAPLARVAQKIPTRYPAIAAALIAIAACAFSAAPASASSICGEGTYAYAGYMGGAASSGVSATIEQQGPIAVHAGHVAGWIGVDEPTTGDAWLQAGLSALPGQTQSGMYYEIAVPGQNPVYHQLAAQVSSGPHTFAVLEQRPNWWVVTVDGRPVMKPVYLRGSHGHWTAEVLGESWAGTVSGACNAYSYSFSGVKLHSAKPSAPAALPSSLHHDPAYTVTGRSRTGFVASSVGFADTSMAAPNATGAASQPPQSTPDQ